MRRLVVLVLVVACDTPPSHVAASPVASAEPATAHTTDTCQHDIPDCEAACALREVHRLDHIDWFDRRCAAVVLGKNPDKAVGYVAPQPTDLDAAAVAAPVAPISCDPPYSLGADGHKMWKRDCFR